MNKVLIFILGMIAGIVLTLFFNALDNRVENPDTAKIENTDVTETPVSETTEAVEPEVSEPDPYRPLTPAEIEEKYKQRPPVIELFDKPGDCVSRKNFEVQKVLDSGDAIAREIREVISGIAITSDLEVLILAREDSHYYEKKVIRTPKGKCARQIGICKQYDPYREKNKVIPVVGFE